MCNKRFSGNVPAQQHLRSEAHIRKVQHQARQSAHPLWCKVCSLQCNSQQQYDTHCDSPRHHHMINQLNIIREQQALTAAQGSQTQSLAGQEVSDENLSLNQPSSGLNAGELRPPRNITGTSVSLGVVPLYSASKVAAAAMSAPAEIPPEGIRFDGSRGHCYVCNIELTSLQHKKQHVEGKQHKKKAPTLGSRAAGMAGTGGVLAGGGEGQGVMMCRICQVPLSGQLNVEQHFNSAKHKARKMEHDHQAELAGAATGGAGPMTPQASSALPELGSFLSLCGPDSIPGRLISFPGQANQQPGAWPSGPAHQPVNTAKGSIPSAGISPQSLESLKFEWHPIKGGFCWACDQQLQSLEEGAKHLGSREHRQREEDLKKQSCDICGVHYSGLASIKRHLNSEQHKNQFLYTQATVSSNTPASGVVGVGVGGGSSPSLSGYKNLLQPSLTSSQLSHIMSNVNEWEETQRKAVFLENSSVLDTPPITPENVRTQPLSFQPQVHPQTQTPAEKVLNALDDGSPSPFPMTQVNIPPSVVGMEPPVGQQSEASSTIPEYVFDGSRGVCNVCSVGFTSKSHADSHLAGSKHQKARLRWQPQATRLQTAVGAQGQAFSEIQGGSVAQCPPASANQGVSATSDPTRAQRAYRFDGSRGYCFACKIDLSSEAHASQHLVGKKHQAAAERWILEGEARSYPLYCDICHKPFTGQESAAQHFLSEKHKKKAALSEGAAAGKKDPVTGALLITLDGQMWYLCEVCRCPLNTPEQFRLHVNSPRHNDQVEKSKQQEHSNRSSLIDPLNVGQLSSPTVGATGPDPTDLQLLTRFSVKLTPGEYVPPPQPVQLSATGLIRLEPGVPRSQQMVPTGFIYSENGFTHGGGESTCPSSTQREMPSSSQVLPGRAVTNSSEGNHNETGNNHSYQQNAELSSTSSSPGQRQSHSGPRFGEGTFSELSLGLAVHQVSRGSAGSRGGRSSAQVLRPDGKYEFDDDDSRSLPTSSSSADYQEGDRQQSEETDSSMTVSTIHSGAALYETAVDMRSAKSIASTTSNNLTSVHTDPGSLTDLAGLRIGREVIPSQQQQQLEPNPFRGFRYSCRLCRQPMNTKEDYDKHMKGVKHQMKAATVSAPDNSKEKLIKMDDYRTSFNEAYKCCKTMPRTYQVELMCKAMGSDSTVVYLPTGKVCFLFALFSLVG